MVKTELLNQTRERVAVTISGGKADKVPFLMIAGNYVPYYCGVHPSKIVTMDDAMKVSRKMAEELGIDCTLAPFFPPAMGYHEPREALGEESLFYMNEEMLSQCRFDKLNIMTKEDYEGIIKEPRAYLFNEIFPRRFKQLTGRDKEKIATALRTIIRPTTKEDPLTRFENETGVNVLSCGIGYIPPGDFFLDFVRGFDGIMSDIKRYPGLVRDAGLAMADEILKLGALSEPLPYKAVGGPLHISPFLSPKDFEKIYWPSFKKITDGFAAQGYHVQYGFEKNYTHLHDFFLEFPPHRVLGTFEEDDLCALKRKVGNRMTICGGLKMNVLSLGTTEECVNMTKALIDTCGAEGDFMLAPDMPLVFARDAKPENFRAVAKTIDTYGRF